jgi:D-serine deaminase-like pyridoxal phosphate-dependent protein
MSPDVDNEWESTVYSAVFVADEYAELYDHNGEFICETSVRDLSRDISAGIQKIGLEHGKSPDDEDATENMFLVRRKK